MKKLHLLLCSIFCCFIFSSSVYCSETENPEAEKKSEKPKAVATGDKIYTWIDRHGNRIYSDEPREGAEVMKISKGTDYTPPETDTSTTPDYSKMKPKVVSTADSYSHFEIASPGNDATIRNNSGTFQVALDIRPKLATSHSVRLEIDGREVPGSSGQIITLNNVDRGTHSLVAYIVSKDNAVIATTKTVTIHLHRAVKRGGG